MIDLQPHLESNLVILEPLGFRDYDDLYKVASDRGIWEQHPTNNRYTELGFEQFFDESLNSSGAMVIRDRASGKVIGSSRFKSVDGTGSVIEIGWTFLARPFWGGQYNRAIKKLMVNYILEKSGTVVLYADKNNFRSQRAISKIGGNIVLEPNFKHHHPLKSNLTYLVKERIED